MGTTNTKEGLPDECPNTQAVSFDVILSPKVENARIPQLTPKKEGALTRQAIDEKIESAAKRKKEREQAMLQKLAEDEQHVREVQQALSEYEERKRRETQQRYQRRLLAFSENRQQLSAERMSRHEQKAQRLEEAKTIVVHKEKTFRELVKEKLSHKMEKFRQNHTRYTLQRRDSARVKAQRLEAVRTARDKQAKEYSETAAEKLKARQEALKENREATINKKVTKVQAQQARVQKTKEELNRSMEIVSNNTMMELEVRLDKSAVKRKLREQEIQEKAKAHCERAKEVKRLREEKERRFSDCTEENLQLKFERAARLREEKAAMRQQVLVRNLEREQKAKKTFEEQVEENAGKLLEKIEDKQRRLDENRAAVLTAKVEQCHQESVKVKQVQETAEELVRSQEKAASEKLSAKLDSYKENRQRRLSERTNKKTKPAKVERKSLQEIQICGDQNPSKVPKSTTAKSPRALSGDENDGGKINELAENFRNRNLEFLGLR